MKTTRGTWKFILRGVCAALPLTGGLSAGGCATRGNVEVLESHLRTQESVIRRYEQDMTRLRSELSTSQKELDLLRSNLASLGRDSVQEENSRSLARVEGITFNSLLTAGQNVDELPGDERLHAVLYPHDTHGDIVKLSGEIVLQAVDLTGASKGSTIGEWKFSPEQSRELWHAGFITSGYQFDLPWQQKPQGSKVLLLAKLTTPDGRTFEATHTLSVSPAVGLEPTAPLPLNEEGIEQVKYEKPLAPVAPRANRPAPNPYGPGAAPPAWQLPGGSGQQPGHMQLGPRDAAGPARPVAPAAGGNGPAPFPSGLRSSDNWTEETIPQWR